MTHLTIDDVINYVSVKKADKTSLELISRVTAHITRCDRCLRRVDAFLTVGEELTRMSDGAHGELDGSLTEEAIADMVKKLDDHGRDMYR
ncbi:MAG: hypothetical protein IJ519_05840 [Clostridia bacterium]|nr:hypothetical protein [Clostridia bacterium]